MISLPRSVFFVVMFHVISMLFCSMAVLSQQALTSSSKTCLHLPRTLETSCVCTSVHDGIGLVCKGLNSTDIFRLLDDDDVDANVDREKNDILGARRFPDEYKQQIRKDVRHIAIKDSSLPVLNMNDFAKFEKLITLNVVMSDVHRLALAKEEPGHLDQLRKLDLSSNNLSSVPDQLTWPPLNRLESLNLSGNAIGKNVGGVFGSLHNLRKLDLSSTNLTENLDPKVFQTLPKSLTYLDISKNSWTCSPKLSWLDDWSKSLLNHSVIQNLDQTRCRYDNSNDQGPLFLLMRYYTKQVGPNCPYRDNCTCLLMHVQEGHVTNEDKRVYSVQVNCISQGLKHFPKLPKHTRTVDLSDNFLDKEAFDILRIEEHNYEEVDNLTLDKNNLEILPEKLLDMALKLSFSAQYNKLTSIPYDFSQRLILSTNVIKLSHNPWKCSCSSRITDLNLISKIEDKEELVCGPSSEIELEGKKIYKLNPELLCPPQSNGEFQELLLQLLCVIFSILIVLIVSKLIYDYWIYRTRGQLPWIVLKMP